MKIFEKQWWRQWYEAMRHSYGGTVNIVSKRHWTAYLPNIDAYLKLGPISLRTSILCERFDSLTMDAFYIEWHFFKWSGRFRLYYKTYPY